ncbi:MAG: adenine deaminase [Deferribacterota bacterium]|nr:adenine deaminase [Deferribacterota bacterium]
MDIVINNALIPDFKNYRFKKCHIGIKNGIISKISDVSINGETVINADERLVSPSLIDCHCHIESSYLSPYYFGQFVANYGTTCVIADPHEIANVSGISGVNYFIENAKLSDIDIKFAASSCVPATNIVKGGGSLTVNDINSLLSKDEVVALGEVMDIEGVLIKKRGLLEKINYAITKNKRINGHAPQLKGEKLINYINYGSIEDDHECESAEEIKEKLEAGLNIFIREGSSATTEVGAYKLAEKYPHNIMFCTDDKSPLDIAQSGHINFHLRKSVKAGLDPLLALKLATINGFKYYNLEGGLASEGMPANLVIFEDMKNFFVNKTIIKGKIFKENYNKFHTPDNLLHSINVKEPLLIPKLNENVEHIIIKVKENSLITEKEYLDKDYKHPEYVIDRDILKLVNIDRYNRNLSAAARIKGFGLKKGAIGSSISHDCHNIVAVGTSDKAIKNVVDKIINIDGGLVCFDGINYETVRLNIGGIISSENPSKLTKDLKNLNEMVKKTGCTLKEPFTLLSFMALEVIPHIKLTTAGLYDVDLSKLL